MRAFDSSQQKASGKRENQSRYKVVTWGFYGGGSTTGLYQLKLGKHVGTGMTIGIDIEKVDFGGTTLQMWDLGGRERSRKLWRAYFRRADGVVFYVDSTETAPDRHEFMRDAMDEFLLEDDLKGVPMLICANKQDLPNAMTTAEVVDALRLSTVEGRTWHVQATSAKTGDGLKEGMAWLLEQMQQRDSAISEQVLESGKSWLERLFSGSNSGSAEAGAAVSKSQQGLGQLEHNSRVEVVNTFLKHMRGSTPEGYGMFSLRPVWLLLARFGWVNVQELRVHGDTNGTW